MWVVFLWQLAVATTVGRRRTRGGWGHGVGSALCEQLDGDCPPCPANTYSPGATLWLSGPRASSVSEPRLIRSAVSADRVIQQVSVAAGHNLTDIFSFDQPATGLHTSIFYFCCHTAAELSRMRSALQAMKWNAFEVQYNGFGCNLDMHKHQINGMNVTYVHALPSMLYQQKLFGLAHTIEAALRSAGLPVNHPRRSMFHMTLARLTPAYNIRGLLQRLNGHYFGSHYLCKFNFMNITVTASNGCSSRPIRRATSIALIDVLIPLGIVLCVGGLICYKMREGMKRDNSIYGRM